MRIARKVFPTIFALIGMLLCSEATKAAQQHVFFIPPGGGLNEVAGGGGSWQSPTTFFTGVGFVTPQNSTVTSFTAGGLLYVDFFCNSRSMRNVLKRRRELDADQHFRRE